MRVSKVCVGAIGVCMLTAGGCDDPRSQTLLWPEGSPEIAQVFVVERVVETTGATRNRPQMAFGDHPEIDEESDDRQVVNAVAKGGQKVRIILDELVQGHTLEQVACADGTFSDIPAGTDPDDIADCTGADRSDCTAVCTQIDMNTNQPVGVLDQDASGGNEGDGAADDFRFRSYCDNGEINGCSNTELARNTVVKIVCDGDPMLIDVEGSFWNPSGNQQLPAETGVNGLGPAIVVVPFGLRTSASCTLQIDPSIVDKDGNQVCAPPGYFGDTDCSGSDISNVVFGVQPFAMLGSSPVNNASGVNPLASMLLQFNQDVDDDCLDAITLETGAGAPVAAMPVINGDDGSIVNIPNGGLLTPNTAYVLTVKGGADGLCETLGGTLPQDIVINFMTGDGAPPPPDAMPEPDAGAADASM